MQENKKSTLDVKHQCKRIRNNLLRGGITILGVKFDAATLRVILRGMEIYKEMEIEAMVNQQINKMSPCPETSRCPFKGIGQGKFVLT